MNNNFQKLRFLIRSATRDDLDALYALALGNDLLNLPTNKDVLLDKINKSMASFAGKPHVADRQFIFVLEDQEKRVVTGTSTVFSSYADENHPLYFFSVYDKHHLAPDVEVPEGCQLLRLEKDTRQLSALGGLVVDARYRGLPEKRGRQISLIRFVLLGMCPDFFSPYILSELMAPTAPDGSNLFWKAIGEKYTGYSYEEVFQSARLKDRSFIQDCFPKEDILLSPEQIHLHRDLESVLSSGRAQQHMITRQGFVYLNQVDPMDGGLQYSARVQDIKCIQNSEYHPCDRMPDGTEPPFVSVLIGTIRDGFFSGGQVPVSFEGDTVLLPGAAMADLNLSPGENIYVCSV